MKLSKILFTIVFVISATCVFAKGSFQEGTDFQVISATAATANKTDTKKILVQEFFSYGCPWCFKLEPKLDNWLKTKPKNVKFERVPVVFEAGWDNYAKAFYLLQSIGKLDKMTSKLFDAVQNQELDLAKTQKMTDFLVKQGLDKATVESALTSSPSIDAQVRIGVREMMQYQVNGVPCFVVAGKYRTDLRMAKGDNQRLLAIVNFLIKKAQKNV